ncbi:MAG: oxidoreductase [Alphaproteobacteria bacterium]|nr:oxidoreductase [Alphaproteobacteria bacterium]
MSLYALIKPDGPSGFGYGSTAEEVTAGLSLAGRRILITGCNSGLGHESLRVLASRGCHVVGTARSQEVARKACAPMEGRALGLACDLSDPESIRACVARLQRLELKLDAIVCNAGIMALPSLQRVCGYESQFFINHIGHFMLVTGLLENLAEDGRVVVVSSAAYRLAGLNGIDVDNLRGENGYRPVKAYGQSKLANLLFAKALARRFEGTERTSNAVHPGISMTTNLIRNVAVPNFLKAAMTGLLTPLALKTVSQAAATQCYATVHPAMRGVSGSYLADCNIARLHPGANDEADSLRLWEASERIVAGI